MSNLPALIRHDHATQLMVDGRPFLMLAGELHNSSASSLSYVRPLLDRLKALGLNTVIAPLSWELVEPEEDRYDFTLVDGLIEAARERELRLVLLWFGTVKNAMSCYVPPWVKTDLERFPRVLDADGSPTRTISMFGEEILACDAAAFAATMRRIREVDGDTGTVLMMQVENEPGVLSLSRDYSEAANRAFEQPVPRQLIDYLHDNQNRLMPQMAGIWLREGRPNEGTWPEVFGEDADEIFMAWHIARFIEKVAQAGRHEHDLPMFANAWLVKGPGYGPGDYPSGGPVPKVLDIWHCAAPHLDLFAPDIYHPDFRRKCELYDRENNPLLIPEAKNTPIAAANALYAFGRHDAIGFGPFAIDDIDASHPLGETYELMSEMMPAISRAQQEGRITGFLQQEDGESWEVELGDVVFTARTNAPPEECTVPGSALLMMVGADEYVVAGRNLTLTFAPASPAEETTDLVWLDTGTFEDGRWIPARRLNGDETAHGTGVLLGDQLECCRFRIHSYG